MTRRRKKRTSRPTQPRPTRGPSTYRLSRGKISAIATAFVVIGLGLWTVSMWTSSASVGLNRHLAKAGNGGDRSESVTTPTFCRDVAPIVYHYCAACHRPGEAAPFSLLSYEEVRKRADQILDVVESRYMPPWKPEPGYAEFVGQRRLSHEQIEMVRAWVDADAPEGNREHLPPWPEFPEGWQLGEPDAVFTLSEPYTLPPEGLDAFRNFVIPAPVDRTRYVRAVEIRPGNKKVAHHGLLKIDKTSTSRKHDAADPGPGYDGMRMLGTQDPDGQFIVWTPGTTPEVESEEMAWRLERGTDLVLQLHMQPTGRPESVRPAIGLFFSDRPPTRTATVYQLYSPHIDIPPGVKDYLVEDSFDVPVDVEVLGIFPHAHYVGKEMKAFAQLPDGTTRWLIHIKDWDFNWQDDYRYVQPLPIPAGSRIVMRYTYDNSADNPRNPHDPPRRVVAGDKSTDEMASLTLRLMTKNEQDRLKLDEAMARVQMKKSGGRDAEATYALATALQSQGNFPEAITYYKRALQLNPKHAPTHCNLGVLLKLGGNPQAAIGHYRQAIMLDPEFADAYTNLGNAFSQIQQTEEAVRNYKIALSLQPDSVGAHYNLAFLLQKLNRLSEAAEHYRETIRLQPDNVAAHNHLAWILATASEPTIRNGQEAVRLARAACELTGSKHHLPLNTLAAAYAEAGDFDQAISAAQMAMDRAKLAGKHGAADQIRHRLDSYRNRQPLRNP